MLLRPRHRGDDHRWLIEPAWYDEVGRAVLDVAATFEVVWLRIDPPVDGWLIGTDLSGAIVRRLLRTAPAREEVLS